VLHLDIASRHNVKSLTDQRLTVHALECAAADFTRRRRGGGAPAYVIVSNDKDYLPLLCSLKRSGIHVAVAVYSAMLSPEVAAAAAPVILLPTPGKARSPALLCAPAHASETQSVAEAFDDTERSLEQCCRKAMLSSALARASHLRSEHALAVAVRRMSPQDACRELASLMGSCAGTTFNGLRSAILSELRWLWSDINGRTFKAFLLDGLKGLNDWPDDSLFCLVEMFANGPADPAGCSYYRANALQVRLGLVLRVRKPPQSVCCCLVQYGRAYSSV
jgi:hypothetical protein